MGTTESKGNHRHHRSNKHHRHKNDILIIHTCQHRNNHLKETLNSGNKNLSKGCNNTAALTRSRLSLNSSSGGSTLHHAYPMQQSASEIQMASSESPGNEILDNIDSICYDYQKDVRRVDEENRPILEGLYPDRMYVSTNDLRVCDTQRLPSPLRCKLTKGYFQPISPERLFQKKTSINSSFIL